jgi:hypothetical protein
MLTEVVPGQLDQQTKSDPSTRCLLSGVPTPYFRVVRNKNQADKSNVKRQIKGTDQRHNIRSKSKEIKGPNQRRSKEPLRDAMSEGQSTL